MKSRNTWLHTAVRAHQAKTRDHLQRTLHAQDQLLEAEELRRIAAQDLSSLRQDWTSRRGATPPGQQIDDVYSRFHGYLTDKNLHAENAREVRRAQLDAATVELRQSHAIQQALEKVAKQRAEGLRQSEKAKEMQTNAEAWLLGQIATKPIAARALQTATAEGVAAAGRGPQKTSSLEG